MKIVLMWHDWLDMPRHDFAWHKEDIEDELSEYNEETSWLKRWSELSDVTYTYTRAKWGGYDLEFPLKLWQLLIGLPYMYGKYTSRYLFFRRAGRKAGASKDIRCVRNPKKPEKLDKVISDQNIKVDREELAKICERQRRYWPLLP
jgi:hypothetical protein